MAQKLHATSALVDEDGRATRVLFVLLNDLVELLEVTIPTMQAEIDALEALVESHHP